MINKLLQFFLISILVVLAFVSIILFIKKSSYDDIKIQDNDLVVGISPDYPPFEFTKNGKNIGFDVDFAYEIANTLKKKIHIKEMDFSSLVYSLNSKKIDMIISSISQNSERAKNISFSIPYYTSKFSIITKKENNAKTINDLKNAKIGVQTGSTMENFINQYNKLTDSSLKIVSLNSNLFLLEKVNLGENDALIIEHAQALTFIKKKTYF